MQHCCGIHPPAICCNVLRWGLGLCQRTHAPERNLGGTCKSLQAPIEGEWEIGTSCVSCLVAQPASFRMRLASRLKLEQDPSPYTRSIASCCQLCSRGGSSFHPLSRHATLPLCLLRWVRPAESASTCINTDRT